MRLLLLCVLLFCASLADEDTKQGALCFTVPEAQLFFTCETMEKLYFYNSSSSLCQRFWGCSDKFFRSSEECQAHCRNPVTLVVGRPSKNWLTVPLSTNHLQFEENGLERKGDSNEDIDLPTPLLSPRFIPKVEDLQWSGNSLQDDFPSAFEGGNNDRSSTDDHTNSELNEEGNTATSEPLQTTASLIKTSPLTSTSILDEETSSTDSSLQNLVEPADDFPLFAPHHRVKSTTDVVLEYDMDQKKYFNRDHLYSGEDAVVDRFSNDQRNSKLIYQKLTDLSTLAPSTSEDDDIVTVPLPSEFELEQENRNLQRSNTEKMYNWRPFSQRKRKPTRASLSEPTTTPKLISEDFPQPTQLATTEQQLMESSDDYTDITDMGTSIMSTPSTEEANIDETTSLPDSLVLSSDTSSTFGYVRDVAYRKHVEEFHRLLAGLKEYTEPVDPLAEPENREPERSMLSGNSIANDYVEETAMINLNGNKHDWNSITETTGLPDPPTEPVEPETNNFTFVDSDVIPTTQLMVQDADESTIGESSTDATSLTWPSSFRENSDTVPKSLVRTTQPPPFTNFLFPTPATASRTVVKIVMRPTIEATSEQSERTETVGMILDSTEGATPQYTVVGESTNSGAMLNSSTDTTSESLTEHITTTPYGISKKKEKETYRKLAKTFSTSSTTPITVDKSQYFNVNRTDFDEAIERRREQFRRSTTEATETTNDNTVSTRSFLASRIVPSAHPKRRFTGVVEHSTVPSLNNVLSHALDKILTMSALPGIGRNHVPGINLSPIGSIIANVLQPGSGNLPADLTSNDIRSTGFPTLTPLGIDNEDSSDDSPRLSPILSKVLEKQKEMLKHPFQDIEGASSSVETEQQLLAERAIPENIAKMLLLGTVVDSDAQKCTESGKAEILRCSVIMNEVSMKPFLNVDMGNLLEEKSFAHHSQFCTHSRAYLTCAENLVSSQPECAALLRSDHLYPTVKMMNNFTCSGVGTVLWRHNKDCILAATSTNLVNKCILDKVPENKNPLCMLHIQLSTCIQPSARAMCDVVQNNYLNALISEIGDSIDCSRKSAEVTIPDVVPCTSLRDVIVSEFRATANKLYLDYMPACKEDGSYAPIQCTQSGSCWCADEFGVPVKNTFSPPQEEFPDCGVKNLYSCERQQDAAFCEVTKTRPREVVRWYFSDGRCTPYLHRGCMETRHLPPYALSFDECEDLCAPKSIRKS